MHIAMFVTLIVMFSFLGGFHFLFTIVKWAVVVVLLFAVCVQTYSWWELRPGSPGFNQHAVDSIKKQELADKKVDDCNDIAPANWSDECRSIMLHK